MILRAPSATAAAAEPKLRVAIISGSWPPDHCGVGDYAERLSGALREQGIEVTCLGGEPWSGLATLREFRRAVKTRRFDLVHIQYPTMGFGRSIVPALLPLLSRNVPIVVTLHEFSSFRAARRLWFVTFAHFVDLRIFTGSDERGKFRRRMKPSRGIDLVVPIGSNIPAGTSTARLEKTICYFGLLCPGKGIEDFLDLAASAPPAGWRFALIGAMTKTYAAYADTVVRRARSLGVALHLDESAVEVAHRLSAIEIAYLPFPDGACDTRGSLHAVMRNGAVVVTKHSERTSASIMASTVHAADVTEAREKVRMLFGDDQRREALRRAGRCVPPGWRDIAADHLAGYTSALRARRIEVDTATGGAGRVRSVNDA